MRSKWFRNLNSTVQLSILSGAILLFLLLYISLSKYTKSTVTSLLLLPLKFSEGLSSNARQFLSFQDIVEENKRLKARVNNLNRQIIQLQQARLENERLRKLLSLPELASFQTQVALVIGKDSSNWTKTIIINRGTSNGLRKGMPVVLGAALVGKVIETYPLISKIALIVDFNSKVPAKVLHSREEGIVFGGLEKGDNICKMKYVQRIDVGDKIISSGLGGIYPKGLLIGEVVKVEEEKNRLYKIAEIRPAVDFSRLEEVVVIVGR